MADISGYAAFVSGTAHEHSREILAELIENIAKSFGGRLSIDQVQGDALCCTIARTDVEVGDWLRETFVAFHRRLRDRCAATTCPCRACQVKRQFSRYNDNTAAMLNGPAATPAERFAVQLAAPACSSRAPRLRAPCLPRRGRRSRRATRPRTSTCRRRVPR